MVIYKDGHFICVIHREQAESPDSQKKNRAGVKVVVIKVIRGSDHDNSSNNKQREGDVHQGRTSKWNKIVSK